MQNVILKTWNEANKETRADFIVVFCQRYYPLLCQVLKDIKKCHPVKDSKEVKPC